jgi:minor extracellular serine protease Vpr
MSQSKIPGNPLLVLFVCTVLVLAGPAAVLAQSDPTDAQGRIFLPLVQQPGEPSDTVLEEGPGVTEIEIDAAETDQVIAANRLQRLSTVAGYRLEEAVRLPAAAPPRLAASLRSATGRQKVIVRLAAPSVGEVAGMSVSASSLQAQQAQAATVAVEQSAVVAAALTLDSSARLLGSTQKAINTVMLEIDAAALDDLAANPAVRTIRPVLNYRLALTDTVPYIGARAVQALGFDGAGIKVAVLDTGIDYTHANLGGSGDPEEYANNDPTIIEPGTFPTAKVVGGYDFVGSEWNGESDSPPELPDPDPLDDGAEAGHGTHVADIIGGIRGVAPAADLYAVKVCSSVATWCSGIALMQAMDFVVDPNDDGDLSDHMDIVNMSLGSDYGTAFDDDLSFAVDVASAIGVLTVAAAGNGNDLPYITGTPAAAPSALSVAQTNVPSAILPLLELVTPASIAGLYAAVHQPWSPPLVTLIEAPVQYADGAGGNRLGCEPFAPDSLTGKIVLVDRGTCNVSIKIANIGAAGGLAGLVALVAAGEPFEFGFGGGDVTAPGFAISQATGNLIKGARAAGDEVIARFDPASGIPLIGHMVGSSSRGPSMGTNIIKPEIGAPGASVSAVAGTGTGEQSFGGTSGATPMVSGAAALLLQAYPDRTPAEIKAVLMNTGEIDLLNRPLFFGGDLAPITRIGGGEVRVDRAVAAPAAAWDAEARSGALSFTFHDIPRMLDLARTVNVHNYSDAPLTYAISTSFRLAADAANGAVQVETPASVNVPAGGDAQFTVKMHIDGATLNDWVLNSGSNGANSAVLTAMEYDGYVTLTANGESEHTLRLPWHVLPRKASDVGLHKAGPRIKVNNRGVGTALVDTYTLLGFSRDQPEGGAGELNPNPDLRLFGYATIPVPAGFCSDDASFILAFAIVTHERQTHANAPVSLEVDMDIDRDGIFDFAVFTANLGDGRNASFVYDFATGAAEAWFLTDHDTNAASTVLYLCGEQIGMNAANFGQPMTIEAAAYDWFFAGAYTDFFGPRTIAPLGDRYFGVFSNGDAGITEVPGRSFVFLRVVDFGATSVNRHDRGLLVLFRGGPVPNREAGAIVIRP